MVAFSYFGVSGKTNFLQGLWLVAQWRQFQAMNRIFGVILCLFGLAVFVRMVISLAAAQG